MSPAGPTIPIDGKRLREERKLRGLTQGELAENANNLPGYEAEGTIDDSDISKYEGGVVQPTAERLERICKALSQTPLKGTARTKRVVPADLRRRRGAPSTSPPATPEWAGTDWQAQIDNFLAEYLGSEGAPVPFGGRDAELDRLDDWLDGEDRKPYLFLTAPAGRGKSALLVRWRARLLAREDRNLHLIFFPISLRFETSPLEVIFKAIALRLMAFHKQKPPTADQGVETWRGLMADLLQRELPRGKRLLLVVDGLDEAAQDIVSPALTPARPPAGLRIVFSARSTANRGSRDWLERLGWQQRAELLELERLDRAGLIDVLVKMGAPLDRLPQREEIIDELARLSEGDPLLVGLYVRDLWQRGEAAPRIPLEELRALRPGLSGYFERWLEDQRKQWGERRPLRERSVQAILNLLAFAKGPLRAADLVELAAFAGVELTDWDLEENLRALRRFVVGDGERQGYSFSHPRLGFYFQEKIKAPRERRRWQGSFIEWGRQAIAAANRAANGDRND